jgi:ParB-like nuclease domain
VSDSSEAFGEPLEPPVAREGLPRHYRMRADRHYVDQLDAPSGGHPVRMIPPSELIAQEAEPTPALRPLIESIRVHGIVHPLLVRRRDSQYVVVAGRKRLVAAQVLQLAAVPCLVQDVTENDSAALAAADNLRVGPSTAGADDAGLPGVENTIADHLASIGKCADMCGAGGGLQRQTLDLLKAHAWRAARLIDARNLIIGGRCASPRERSMASILDEVIEGFSTECRLSGVTIHADVREALSSAGLHDNQLAAGVSGALLAVLPLVEYAVRPSILIKASNSNSHEVVVDVLQNSTPVAQHVADEFFSGDRRGDDAARIGARAAKALADAHDGHATFEVLPHGSRLSIVMKRRS